MEYLRRFRPEFVPTEEELAAVRFEFDPAPPLETLMLHFCGEVRLTQWYRKASDWHTEPVIRQIYALVAADEGRHAGAYRRYMARALERTPDEARAAFAKVGVLMASGGRGGKPLHPTNLHVSKAHYPQDTVQSRLPDPGWLDHWLEEQIVFDAGCEERVVERILATLSGLLGQDLPDVRALSRYRRALPRASGDAGRQQAPSGGTATPALAPPAP
jgi:hypothetical protein